MLDLRSRFLVARVLPEIGSCLESVMLIRPDGTTTPVLLAPSVAAMQAGDARQAAHFPMLPFVNRVPGNMLRCEGREFSVAPNTDEPLALHGTGWQGSWRVLSQSPEACEMELHAPTGFPFDFRASQKITLSDSALLIEPGLTNTSSHPIPVGLGFHPYFPRDQATRLQFNADWFWLEGPGHLPTDAIRTPPELSFAMSRALPDRWRANCYTGWTGPVVIDQPARGHRIEMIASKGLRDLMVYAPPGTGFFAVEPQSHTTGFLDTQSDSPTTTPLHALPPNAQFAAWMKVTVRFLPV